MDRTINTDVPQNRPYLPPGHTMAQMLKVVRDTRNDCIVSAIDSLNICNNFLSAAQVIVDARRPIVPCLAIRAHDLSRDIKIILGWLVRITKHL